MQHIELMSKRNTLTERLTSYLRRYYDLGSRREAFRHRRFYSLEIELTNRCNRECLYCYNSSSRQCLTPDLPFDFVERLIGEAEEAGVRQIAWLGGEPLLYRRLPELLQLAHSRGIENVLFTNGSLLNAQNWRLIRPWVGRLMFHLDTIATDTFVLLNNVIRTQGTEMLSRTKQNLRDVLSAGFDPDRVCFYVVLTRPAYQSLEATLEWALHDVGVGTTALYPMVRTGRACRTAPGWDLSRDELQKAFELRASIENREELLLLGPSEYCKHYQLTMAYLNVHGQLMPYAGITAPLLDATASPLASLLREHYDELSFSTLGRPDPSIGLTGRCKFCQNSEFCFGTRTTAFNQAGFVWESDPFCWLC